MRNDASDGSVDANGRNDLQADTPNHEGQVSAEAESQGRDVHDTSRGGVARGTDVLSAVNPEEIEDTGRTVVDHSRRAETRGVDVIDLGPVDEPPDGASES